jgi:phosphatidylglycerol:prolipoprotein diacylglycerol transferase
MQPLIPWFTPPAFELGPVTVHGFGILVAIGFWVGSVLAQRKVTQFTTDPQAPDRINRMVTWLIVGMFVGGHLGHVLWYDPASIAKDPMVLLRFWEGLSSTGGFAFCVPATILFFRKERVSYWPYADALAWGFALGYGFGRLGCFSAHDHPGVQSDFYLAVYGMCPGNNPAVACLDMGLLEAIYMFVVVFGGFLIAGRKPRPLGFYTGLLPLLYGPWRFTAEFFRHPDGIDARYFGLTPAQYGAILITLLGVGVMSARGRAPTP